MVDIATARQQVEAQKQKLLQEQQRIQQTQMPEIQKQQLLTRTMFQREQLRERERLLNLEKARAVKELKKYEAEVLQPYEMRVGEAEAQQRAYQEALARREFAIEDYYRKLAEQESRLREARFNPATGRFDLPLEQIPKEKWGSLGIFPMLPEPPKEIKEIPTTKLPSWAQPQYVSEAQRELLEQAGISYAPRLKPPFIQRIKERYFPTKDKFRVDLPTIGRDIRTGFAVTAEELARQPISIIPTTEEILMRRRRTLGELGARAVLPVETAAVGYERLIRERVPTKIIPERRVPIYARETLIGPPGEYIPPTEIVIPEEEERVIPGVGLVPEAVRLAPYITPLWAGYAGAEFLAAGERMKMMEQQIETEKLKSWEEYQKIELTPEEKAEGYRKHTKEEYLEEVTPQIEEAVRAQLETEALIPGAILTAGAIGAGIRAIPRRPYLRARIFEIGKPKVVEDIFKIERVPEPTTWFERVSVGDRTLEFFKGKGKDYFLQPGRITILEKRRAIPFTGYKPIYEGIPYTKLGRRQYKKALKELTKKVGLTERQAREYLRYYQPVYGERRTIADIMPARGVPGADVFFKAETKTEFPVIGKIYKTRKKAPYVEYLGSPEEIGKFAIGKIEKGFLRYPFRVEKARLTREGYPFTKIKELGKADYFIGISKIKKIGEVPVTRRVRDFFVTPEDVKIGLYKQLGITKRIIKPSKKIIPSISFMAVEERAPKLVGEFEPTIFFKKLGIKVRPEKKGITFIPPADIKKTPLAKTFQVQVPSVILPKPEVKPIKFPKPPKEVVKKVRIIPKPPIEKQKIKDIQIPKPKKKIKVEVTPAIIPAVIPRITPAVVSPLEEVKEERLIIPRIRPLGRLAISPLERLREKQKIVPRLRVLLKQKQEIIPVVVPRTTHILRPSPPKPPPRRPPRKPRFFRWWFPEGELKKPTIKPKPKKVPIGFEVFVRRRGEPIKISPAPIPRGEALFLGRKVTKETAAAMFFLKPVKERVVTLGLPWITERALAIEFRKPIRKGREIEAPLTFVQKRTFRIATPGEFKEITLKGIAARSKRRGWWT
jgi:hypothetical protein